METALNGRLTRHPSGWYWADGTPEPRARDMRLRDLAPNLRCLTFGDGSTVVEVPCYWQDLAHDAQARQAIANLVRVAGKPASIYAEGVAEAMDDHRRTIRGWYVPIEYWDAVMSEVVGVAWDHADEVAIMARAGNT